MMTTLFSPSEQKIAGGSGTFADKRDQLFGGWEIRSTLAALYEKQLAGSDAGKKKLTGWSDVKKIDALPKQLGEAPVLPAIERFAGVGFQYLDYASLNKDVQRRLQQIWIFSNLLGPVRGSDLIPETKLKQTPKLGGVQIGSHYKNILSDALDEVIATTPVLDLRAKVYRTWYQPKGQVIVPEFLKAGKRVNHWSKAYRGLLLRYVAMADCNTLDYIVKLKMPELQLVDRVEDGGEVRLVYEA